MEIKPLDFVTVTVFGLNYRGRVVSVIDRGPGHVMFNVQYADDKGDLRNGDFWNDELERAK